MQLMLVGSPRRRPLSAWRLLSCAQLPPRIALVPLLIVLVGHRLPGTFAVEPSRQASALGGNRASGSTKGGKGKEDKIVGNLDPSPDPKAPHSLGFEPRPGPSEHDQFLGPSDWTFGQVHHTVHHVLHRVPEGDAVAVGDALDAFSTQHQLGLGLGSAQVVVLDGAARAAAALAAGPSLASNTSRGARVLVLGAGIGAGTLRCLPPLLENGTSVPAPGWAHEVVSVEENDHLSDSNRRLVQHALGADGTSVVKHTPLMPGEGTVLSEVLETLHDGYEIGSFDLVLLDSGRASQRDQLETLIAGNSLHHGAIIYADGASSDDAETKQYLKLLQDGEKGMFDIKVHDLDDGGAAIVSTVRSLPGRNNNEL